MSPSAKQNYLISTSVKYFQKFQNSCRNIKRVRISFFAHHRKHSRHKVSEKCIYFGPGLMTRCEGGRNANRSTPHKQL